MSGPILPGTEGLGLNEQSMQVLEWLGDQIPGGFFIYRAGGAQELVYANRVIRSIFGCESEEEFRELTGNTFPGMVHPEERDAVLQAIDEQIADCGRENLDFVEYRILRRDGEVRWVDDYGHCARLAGFGDVFYVFLSDVTDKHSVQEESRRRAEVIDGLSADFSSIFLLNLDTGTMRPYRQQSEYFNTLASERGVEQSGIADWREILPAYGDRYVWEGDRERFLREISEQRVLERLKSEHAYTVDYRCGFGEESEEFSYMQMSVVGIDVETANHAVLGFRDVTEQTLRVQREMAERLKTEMELEREKHANEIKSAFLFNISHDIRTPMNAIMGFTELSRMHIDKPERLKTYLGKVEESSRHMLSLIDDLLEMSKLDYGRIELRAEPTDLRSELQTVVDMFRGEAEGKNLSLEEKIDLPEGEVLVDASRFRRIMANLLSNGVKFTPSGGAVTVTARQKQVSDSGYARFEFTVADTGIGMSEEFMKHMYAAFEREESSTRSGSTGTGLGLSIVKNLLDIMGGSISVRSRKGEGSVFTVDLPLKLAGFAPESVQRAESADHRAAGEHRILLVEDIEINRMLAETILEDAGFLVESVPDGCDAVEAITNHPQWYYDLVLMDIQMPVMNGYEATRSIRAIGREDTRTIPIIALSANAREEDKRQSLESGMNNHIAKPFDVARLISTVNEYIARRESKQR